MENRALFLDRDGVINEDLGYVHEKENFFFIEGVFDLIRVAAKEGFKIVVVTNQAGIGRGYYTEKQFLDLTDWMIEEFLKKECPVDKVYYSPFHPTEGIGLYRKSDFSRKPNPGMLFEARDELNIDMTRSLIIGDKESDMVAGARAGLGTLLYFNRLGNVPSEEIFEGCYLIKNLYDAPRYILTDRK